MPRPTLLLLELGNCRELHTRLVAILDSHFEIQDSESKRETTETTPTSKAPAAVVVLTSMERCETAFEITSLVKRHMHRPVLVVADAPDPKRIMTLLACGVADFITHPFSDAEVLPRLWRLIGPQDSRERCTRRIKQRLGLKQLIGESPAFRAAVDTIPILANADGTVLIDGETGTGKEVCARAIHYLSARSGRPFIPINCGAIPLELLENELFGHERGAFTGAAGCKTGLIEEAQSGTLFLDEVDALPPSAQVKLLRLLQEKEYRPLGSRHAHTADIRIIAATNTHIDEALRTGKLRQDFYYRLNVLPLTLPSLRERSGDVVLLARHFAVKHAEAMKRPQPALSTSALNILVHHHWPGNVRELEHVIERAVALAQGALVIQASDVRISRSPQEPSPSFREAKARVVARFERSYLERLLAVHDGNVSRAARAARKHRRAFWELIRKHDIDTERYRTMKTG